MARKPKAKQPTDRVFSLVEAGGHREYASARMFTRQGMKAHLGHGKRYWKMEGNEVVEYQLVEVSRESAAKFCGVPSMLRLKGKPTNKGEG